MPQVFVAPLNRELTATRRVTTSVHVTFKGQALYMTRATRMATYLLKFGIHWSVLHSVHLTYPAGVMYGNVDIAHCALVAHHPLGAGLDKRRQRRNESSHRRRRVGGHIHGSETHRR